MSGNRLQHWLSLAAHLSAALLLLCMPLLSLASSWDATLLVNTESFQIIDEGDGSSDVYLQFGDTLSETVTFNRSIASFDFSDDVYIRGDVEVVGTMSGQSLYVTGTGASPILVASGGTVGIGTATPEAELEILSDGIPEQYISTFDNAGGGQLVFRRARGTSTSPTALEFGNSIGGVVARGYGASGFSPNRAAISFSTAEDWTDSAQGTEIRFQVTQSGSTTGIEAMRITASGNVAIGQTVAETELDVKGSISGTTLTVSTLENCDTIDTDADGNLICGTDGGSILQSAYDGDPDGGDADIALSNADNAIVITNPATGGVTGTAAVVIKQHSGAVVALDIHSDATSTGAVRIGAKGTSDAPHILFGSGGTFDTNLFRQAANVLRTDDSFVIGGTLGIGTVGTGETALEVVGTMSGTSLWVNGTGSTPLIATDTNSGRVGVGTTAPETLLDVQGSLSGQTLTVSDLRDCNEVRTNSLGDLVCADQTGQFSDTAGGLDVNVSTPVGIPWNNEIREDFGISHSSSSNTTRVSLREPGWYRIAYSVNHEDQSANRKNIRCRVRMNGTTFLDYSNSYSFGRNTTDEWATNNATMLVETTSVNEYYEVMCNGEGSEVDTVAANTVAGENWTLVEKLRTMATVGSQYSDTTGGVNLNGALVAVDWDNEVREDYGFTHSTTVNPSQVTLDEPDWYRVTYSVSHESGGGRRNVRCRARLNGTTFINESNSYSYSRSGTDEWATNKATFIFETTSANEYYEILCNGEGSAGTATSVVNQSWTVVEKVSSISSAVAQVTDATGGLDVNVAAPVAIPWDAQSREDVGFSHSTTVANTQVHLIEPDWYRITYSVSHEEQANNRKNVRCRIRMNGATFIEHSNSYSYSRTITDEWATNNATVLVQTTSANEYYEVLCNGEGTGVGSQSANTVATESWTLAERLGVGAGEGTLDDAYDADTGERTIRVDDGDVSFDLSGTNDFIIDLQGTGNVGINTETPTTALEVSGVMSGSLLNDQSPSPTVACSATHAGRQWVDTDTGFLYICDVSNGRNKWLTTHDMTLEGEQNDICGNGEDISNEDACAVEFGGTLGAHDNTPDSSYFIAHDMTITGYGFSADDDNCAATFDIEVWSTGGAGVDEPVTFEQNVATGLGGEAHNASNLNIDISGNQYILWGIDNNCGGGIDDFNVILYYRWRHD